jgi:signal peptidase I
MVEASEPAVTTPPQRDSAAQPAGLLPAVQSLLYVLIVALFLITFTVQPIRIPSGSMEPTLLIGDFLLLDKEAVTTRAGWLLPPGSVARGDVVVFHDPVDDPAVHLVKRVVGLPGDRLHLRDGIVYLNGRRLQEAYAVRRGDSRNAFRDDFPDLHTMEAGVNANWWVHLRGLVHDGEITVPAGHYFVMGDNRNDSEDSRYWGFVPRDAIVGEPLLVYLSIREPEPGESAASVRTEARRSTFVRWKRTFQVVR